MSEVQTVTARAFQKDKRTWTLEVRCVFCKSLHWHRGGSVVQGHDAPMDEFYCERIAPCGSFQDTYILVREVKL
jgi:hypothetical protein